MKYQVAVTTPAGTRTIICNTRFQASRVALVLVWTVAPDRAFCEADFLLTRRTTSAGWYSSNRAFHVTVTRLES